MRARTLILLLVALAAGFALGRGTLGGAGGRELPATEPAARAAGPSAVGMDAGEVREVSPGQIIVTFLDPYWNDGNKAANGSQA